MEFPIEKEGIQNTENYSEDELDITYEFAKKVHEELEGFIKALVLFGSTARKKRAEQPTPIGQDRDSGDLGGTIEAEGEKNEEVNDIDVLLIVDDVTFKLTKELVQTYRIVVEKLIRDTSTQLHVITLKFSSFWEYVRSGDPVAVNVLRDGVPIIGTGFFEPLQRLLKNGRIRPSPESMWSYFQKAPMSLQNSQWHVRQAVLDLYWAVIDSAHAALMKLKEVPPSPEHVADLLEEKLVKPGVVEPKYAKTMRNFYHLMKGITHGDIKEISGEDYDHYYEEAEAFVKEMEEFLKK